MARQQQRTTIRYLLWLPLLWACFALPAPLQAQETTVPANAASLPAGPAIIDNVPAPVINSQDGEFTAFDLFVGGVNYGLVYGHYAADWFQPDMATDVVALLPAVKRPNDFMAMFEGRIEKIRHIRDVGTLTVDTTHFKLSLEVDQAQTVLSTVAGLGDLKGTEQDFSIRNNLFMASSSNTDHLDLLSDISTRHDTIFSKGDFTLQSTGTFTSENGYDLTNALIRKDFTAGDNEMTLHAGLLQTNNNLRFARSLDYAGLRLATNEALLFRDTQLQASSIQLFLPRRAQVTIYRDTASTGRILYSRILNFGTVQIDTRAFPTGSYNIETIISSGGTILSREITPFTKTQNLPPHGRPEINFEAGEVRTDLDTEGVTLATASYNARLTDSIGGRLGIAATSSDQVYEASLSMQKPLTLFRQMGILETSLTGAFDSRASPAGMEATVRWSSEKAALSAIGTKTYLRTVTGNQAGSLALSDRQSAQFNLSMPLQISRYRIFSGVSAEFSQSAQAGSNYRYGPTLSYTFDSLGSYVPTLKVEYSKSADEQRALATLSFRNVDPVWHRFAEMTAGRVGEDTSTTALASINYTGRASKHTDWRRRVTASLGLRLDPLTSTTRDQLRSTNSRLEYSGDIVRFQSYLDQNLSGAQQGQLSTELESTALWSPKGGLQATSQNVSSDMALVMVALKGDFKKLMHVTVNGSQRAAGYPGDTVALPLAPYEKAKINVIDSIGRGAYKAKENPYTVIGYPGNVAYRVFHIVKPLVLMGILEDENGIPLRQRRFTYHSSAYYTDDNGFFTLEDTAQAGSTITFEGFDFSCPVLVPSVDMEEASFIDLNTLRCVGKEKATP